MRREVFVGARGWKLQIREDGGEYDRVDQRHRHLLATRGQGDEDARS
jgi:N-acyl-L-homoserine lactone synthetase